MTDEQMIRAIAKRIEREGWAHEDEMHDDAVRLLAAVRHRDGRIAELTAIIDRYAGHYRGCPAADGGRGKCSCGFSAGYP